MNSNPEEDGFLENFDKDRNVILKLAQRQLCPFLTKVMVEMAIEKYKELYNPLGLIDSTYQRILGYQFNHLDRLDDVYENLSVAYRYKHGDNQLEIVWDGRTQIKKYEDDWVEAYTQWSQQLSTNPSFVKAVLQLTALSEEDTNDYFIQNHLKGLVNDFFELKVLKRNGVKRVIVKTKLPKSA